MTTVAFYRDHKGRLKGFSVVGHTDSIVCAAVSALSITAVNALESIAKINVKDHVSAGVLQVRLPLRLTAKQRYHAQIILRTIHSGFKDIAAEYSNNLTIR